MPPRDENRQPDTKGVAMPSFMLRRVDEALWIQFRERVTADGYTPRWVLLELIGYYIRHGLPKER
jgi:hypothetical protein